MLLIHPKYCLHNMKTVNLIDDTQNGEYLKIGKDNVSSLINSFRVLQESKTTKILDNCPGIQLLCSQLQNVR